MNNPMDMFSGRSGSQAALDAADLQAREAKRALNEFRSDLSPYVQAGVDVSGAAGSLASDPMAQINLLNSSPIFRSMMD